MSALVTQDTIQVVGAGPAGLAAAITLARAGRHVVVHETTAHVGSRFRRDHQGLENWTTDEDVVDEFRALGITAEFSRTACREATAFDSHGKRYDFRSRTPFLYIVERGSTPGSLDAALLAQAEHLGVDVRFNSTARRVEGPVILAAGPRAADAIAVGFHFDTPMPDGCWIVCDDALAPQGYAYLIVMKGRGTVKSCMFSGFKQEAAYVAQTVARFCELVRLEMKNPQPHGGAGNFRIPRTGYSGAHPVAGEQAGFQDTLWGFGMRYAIQSGVLAARSLLEGSDYDARWRMALQPTLRSSVVNRAIFGRLGNAGYSRFLRKASAHDDARTFLRELYRPSWLRRLLYPWARVVVRSKRRDVTCNHVDCTCVWCRCGGHA